MRQLHEMIVGVEVDVDVLVPYQKILERILTDAVEQAVIEFENDSGGKPSVRYIEFQPGETV